VVPKVTAELLDVFSQEVNGVVVGVPGLADSKGALLDEALEAQPALVAHFVTPFLNSLDAPMRGFARGIMFAILAIHRQDTAAQLEEDQLR
jgi:hypothetical protein